MNVAALRKAGGKPRRENNSTALVVITVGFTRFFGYFSDRANAQAFVEKHTVPGNPRVPVLTYIADKPLYIFNNRLDSFRDTYSSDLQFGKRFLKHFSADVENQKLDPLLVGLFERCISIDSLWYLIGRYTVIQG